MKQYHFNNNRTEAESRGCIVTFENSRSVLVSIYFLMLCFYVIEHHLFWSGSRNIRIQWAKSHVVFLTLTINSTEEKKKKKEKKWKNNSTISCSVLQTQVSGSFRGPALSPSRAELQLVRKAAVHTGSDGRAFSEKENSSFEAIPCFLWATREKVTAESEFLLTSHSRKHTLSTNAYFVGWVC